MHYKPQKGCQEKALATPADGAVIGGSAGGGKTFIKLMEATRHVKNPNFGFVGFRRTTQQIRSEGGLWDTSKKIFSAIGGIPRESSLEWTFPSGSKGKFAHLEHEKNALDWQGSQIPFIFFDELTHFTEYQFWYMLSRNRTDCGVRPYWRGSCNPSPTSFVRDLVDWYIGDDGFPIYERAGILRYYSRDGENMVWGDTPHEVIEKAPHIFKNAALKQSGVDIVRMVKTFTFIPGSITENKIFIKNDPGYFATLLSLPAEEKLRLLDGNWNISLDGLMIPEYARIETIFTNYPELGNSIRCITCDAARFGRDFCVIMVWKGFEVIFMIVMKISDSHDIVTQIEFCRRKFSVTVDNVVVDQDGVGDGTVKLGGYDGFHGGAPAVKDPDTRIKENYDNYKTQCVYRFSNKRINTGQLRFSINTENCLIFDGSSSKGLYTTKIKVNGKIQDIKDLIKQDIRTWKRSETKDEGADKIKMINKEEQKTILKRSPDFGDCTMMREHIELRPEQKKMKRVN